MTRSQSKKSRITSPSSLPDSRTLSTLRRRLLRWFAQHQRDLPWRHDRDPYRIWVSEVMLQQTQVVTVIPYFERFLQTFPTLADLAAANEQEVLRLWEGLGYYRRARNLHRASRIVMAEHGGQLPREAELVAELPGMGRYMVGAVLSQAFDARLPIVEANSRRVLCRLFGQREDPRRGPAQRWLWETSAAMLPRRQVGDFNQALMELGALVCTPVSPDCPACPLKKHCVVYRRGLQEEIPARPIAPEIVEVKEAAAVVRRGSRVLLVQRPDDGRWAGMWEFPHSPLKKGETHEETITRWLIDQAGLQIELGPELATIRHGVTRFRITLVCFEADHVEGEFRSTFYTQGRWVKPEQLNQYPVSVPQRRLTQILLEPHRQRRLF